MNHGVAGRRETLTEGLNWLCIEDHQDVNLEPVHAGRIEGVSPPKQCLLAALAIACRTCWCC
jgi:hypothetical protein